MLSLESEAEELSCVVEPIFKAGGSYSFLRALKEERALVITIAGREIYSARLVTALKSDYKASISKLTKILQKEMGVATIETKVTNDSVLWESEMYERTAGAELKNRLDKERINYQAMQETIITSKKYNQIESIDASSTLFIRLIDGTTMVGERVTVLIFWRVDVGYRKITGHTLFPRSKVVFVKEKVLTETELKIISRAKDGGSDSIPYCFLSDNKSLFSNERDVENIVRVLRKIKN